MRSLSHNHRIVGTGKSIILVVILALTPGCTLFALSMSDFLDRMEEQGCKVEKARYNGKRETVDIECK